MRRAGAPPGAAATYHDSCEEEAAVALTEFINRKMSGASENHGKVLGLRPSAVRGQHDEVLLRESCGRLAWVSEAGRPDLAKAVTTFVREVNEQRGRRSRAKGCTCFGCLSPSCSHCGVPQCGGIGGRRRRCKNKWCEKGLNTPDGHIPGRGRLLREQLGTIVNKPVDVLEEKGHNCATHSLDTEEDCITLCAPLGGSEDRQVPCPRLALEDLVTALKCAEPGCQYDRYAFATAHAEHLKSHNIPTARISALVRRSRGALSDLVAADVALHCCPLPPCQRRSEGARGLYQHLLTAHWPVLPRGAKLQAAAQVSLALGRHRPFLEGNDRTRVTLVPSGRLWAVAADVPTKRGLVAAAAALMERIPFLQKCFTGIGYEGEQGGAVHLSVEPELL